MIKQPCSRVIFDGTEVEIFRCQADGGLVFQHQDLLCLHPGHRFSSPVIFKEGELEEIGKTYEELNGKKDS